MKGARWHIIPQLAIYSIYHLYTTYSPCLLGGYMLPTSHLFMLTRNNHWIYDLPGLKPPPTWTFRLSATTPSRLQNLKNALQIPNQHVFFMILQRFCVDNSSLYFSSYLKHDIFFSKYSFKIYIYIYTMRFFYHSILLKTTNHQHFVSPNNWPVASPPGFGKDRGLPPSKRPSEKRSKLWDPRDMNNVFQRSWGPDWLKVPPGSLT